MSKIDQGMPLTRRYQYVPRVLIFLERDAQILLIKGAADKRVWPNLYNGLGGHVERGESILEAAEREVYEESGLSRNRLWLCASVSIDTEADTGIVMWVFRGRAGEGELKESAEGSLEWVNREGIEALDLVVDLPVLIPQVFSLNEGDSPIWGHYWYEEDQFKYKFS